MHVSCTILLPLKCLNQTQYFNAPYKGDINAMEKKQDIENKVDSLKKEIHTVSTNLKDLSNQKENQYQEKSSLDNQLNKLISNAKDQKDKKKDIDKKIRDLKHERDNANNLFNKVLTDLKEAQKKKHEYRQKGNFNSPNKLRSQIKELEYKVQTEVLKFKKEKEIMDQIKRIKNELNKIAAEEDQFKDIEEYKKQSFELKKKADDIHKQIQDFANESSSIFDELTKLSKDISDIKAKRNTLQIVLKGLKIEINKLNQNLSVVLKSWSDISDHTFVKHKARGGSEIIQKKTAEVKEKLKAKKKLTTDDILLLQREAMRK